MIEGFKVDSGIEGRHRTYLGIRRYAVGHVDKHRACDVLRHRTCLLSLQKKPKVRYGPIC